MKEDITTNKVIEFIGTPSGDGESFCFDVDEENFIKVKGELPNEYDECYQGANLFRIYPDYFFGFDEPKCKIKISIEILK